MERDKLINILKNGTATVKFTKTNGEERVMQCTLKESVVQDYEKKTERVKQHNPEILSVWDVEKNAWRSFRFDSIKEVIA